MKVQFFRQDALDAIRRDVAENISNYAAKDEPWVEDYFQKKNIKLPLFNSDLDVSDIDLIHGSDAKNDAENAIRVYEAFRGIKPVQATDRRMWAALTHTVFYGYMKSRWQVDNILNDNNSNGTITDRYLLNRGLFRNGLSRLYWIPELTIDEALSDPYEYTRYLIGYQDLINQIEGYSLSRNRKILLSILKTLKDSGSLKEAQIRLFFETICKRGGVLVLDALPADKLEETCHKALDSVMKTETVKDGSRLTLRSIDSGHGILVTVKAGKAYSGKTLLKTSPSNLYRLSLGKELTIDKLRYRIDKIEQFNL